MKYFNPSYWFKLWVLSAPLFNDKTQGINANSIDNKKIKDWVSNNTSLESIENQELTLSNNQTIQLQNDENIQSIKNLETDHFYENFLKTQGWSRDPQIAQQQLQEIQEEHHHFLEEQHEKNKNKHKRQSRNDITTPKINIEGASRINARVFFNNLKNEIFQFLEKNGIFTCITERSLQQCLNYFILNKINKYKYFIIPMSINNRNFSLVFRTSDLYLQGFINNNYQDYYYFRDAEIKELSNLNNIDLGFAGNYNNLINGNPTISWQNTYTAFENLANHNSRRPSVNFREELARIILATAESFRFGRVSSYLIEDREHNWNDFYPIVTNWETQTENALSYMREHNNLDYFSNENNIIIFSQIMNSNLPSCSRYSSRSIRSINDFCYIDNNFNSNIETQIQTPKSCEVRFYYGNGNKEFKTSWGRGTTQDFHVVTLNLEKNNPLNFDKISVLNEQATYTKTSWGNDPYLGTKFSDFLKNKKIHNFITNEKINENEKENFFKNHNFYKLQDFCKNGNFDDKMCTVQSIYSTFYWENEKYYLQFFIQQWTWSVGGLFMDFGARWMNIGDGIILQNENCGESRKKRNIESNENKWTDDIKSINQEQHLPIDNKTNFVTNNITSL